MFIIDPTIEYNQLISATTKSALRALASHCGATNVCWPSMDRIARFMSRSVRTTRRAIRELLELKLIERQLHHTKTPTYRILCMIERLSRAERRRRAREQGLLTGVINRGDKHDPDLGSPSLYIEQTNLNNATIKKNGQLSTDLSTVDRAAAKDNGTKKLLKPKPNHPAFIKVIADDLAEGLGSNKSLKYYMWLAWRVSEDILYEAMSWVRQEECRDPGRLFTWRLRTYYNLAI